VRKKKKKAGEREEERGQHRAAVCLPHSAVLLISRSGKGRKAKGEGAELSLPVATSTLTPPTQIAGEGRESRKKRKKKRTRKEVKSIRQCTAL